MTRLAAAILASIAALVLVAQPALADHLRAKLDVAVHTSVKVEQGYVVDALLVRSDGKAVGDATLRFSEVVDFFGKRDMVLGAATTDSQGMASFSYMPAQPGRHEIVVRFAGREHVSPAEGRFLFDATIAKPVRHAERPALAQFSDRLPYAVGVIVLAVWGLIGYALFTTARGVIGGARRTP